MNDPLPFDACGHAVDCSTLFMAKSNAELRKMVFDWLEQDRSPTLFYTYDYRPLDIVDRYTVWRLVGGDGLRRIEGTPCPDIAAVRAVWASWVRHG